MSECVMMDVVCDYEVEEDEETNIPPSSNHLSPLDTQ